MDGTPPQAIDAEQGVLGALLRDFEAMPEVANILNAAHVFYRAAHQHIYDVCLDRFRAGKPVDLVLMHEDLRDRQQLDDTGGDAYRGNALVHSCGTEGAEGGSACKNCGNCLREYFATMERLRG